MYLGKVVYFPTQLLIHPVHVISEAHAVPEVHWLIYRQALGLLVDVQRYKRNMLSGLLVIVPLEVEKSLVHLPHLVGVALIVDVREYQDRFALDESVYAQLEGLVYVS